MRNRLPIVALAVLSLAVLSADAFAREPEHIELPAQDSAPVDEYTLDEQTELSLEQSPANPAEWAIDLRRYGAAAEGQVMNVMGTAKKVAADVLEYTADEPSKARSLRLSGQPGKGPLELTSKNLVLDSGEPVKLAGTFHPITAAAHLRRAKARWQEADAVLNEVYRRVRAQVGKSDATKLRDLQSARIEMRDERAAMEARGTDEPETKSVYWETMLGYTVDNIALLKIYSGRDIPKGLTGSYRDMFGGELDLRETRQGLRFSMSVVRGRASHIGEIGGVAAPQGNRATYVENLSKEDADAGEKAARLTFTFSAGHIVHVAEEHTARFGGAGIYFGGDYYKAGPLKAPIELTEGN